MDPRLRDGAASFSWVSLVFYEAYRRAPAPITELDYGTKDAWPNILAILVLLAVVVVTSAAVFAVLRAARARGQPWTQALAFLMVISSIVPLSAIARELGLPVDKARWGTLAGGILLLVLLAIPVVGLWVVRKHPERSLTIAISTLVVLAPFGAVIAVQAGFHAGSYASMDLEPVTPRGSQALGGGDDLALERVVLLVFDELDRTLAFEHRPASVALPQLDALVNRSLEVTEAYSTTAETMTTMHALLTGLQLQEATPVSVDELVFEHANGTESSSTEATPLFEAVREAGGRSAVAGWYHPYCRVYEIETCAWHPFGRQPEERSVHSNVLLTVTRAAAALPPVVTRNPVTEPLYTDAIERFSKAPQLKAIESYQFLSQRALDHVGDPSYDLVFVHLNVPHPADARGYYDPATGELTAGEGLDYYDNLALVDRTIGELGERLVDAGLWNDTALLVTGDHGYRQSSWGPPGRVPADLKDATRDPLVAQTVPLIVKPPWTTGGLSYEEPVDNVLVHDLALAFLAGELTTDEELLAFVDAHRRSPMSR